MQSILSQEIARQHREELIREAQIERQLAQTYGEQHASKQSRSWLMHKNKTVLQARSIHSLMPASELDFAEIKRELQGTLAALHEADASSKELYIDAFIQKLGQQLADSSTVLLVQAPIPGYRLILLIALLCTLMPLVGMVLGVGQDILLAGCLLCLAGLISTIIAKWA